jgi:hypothetical protein
VTERAALFNAKLGGGMLWNFAEHGCARIVSRSALKMLRLVSAAALRSKLPRLADARVSWQHFRDGKK